MGNEHIESTQKVAPAVDLSAKAARFHKAPRYFYRNIIESFNVKPRHFSEFSNHETNLFLRHDEDWNIDFSIKLAELENEVDIRSTYFLNHSEPYFDYSPEFVDKCKKIVGLGHEIGIHNNALEEYYRNNTPLIDSLAKPIDFLRNNGIEIKGVSSHGSMLCQEKGTFNFEIWQEFEGSRLASLKQGERFCGEFDCERIKLSDLDLDYDASLLDNDCYISDSSGRLWGFFRVGVNYKGKVYDLIETAEIFNNASVIKHNIKEIVDITNTSMDSGLIQILFHPIWWLKKEE